ncbi:MAG: MBL fold metallo-hydrolase [Clostridia bacterium]|nr:MBL fold metallo-hydrolase [Clostridia bacterium]
MKLTFLGAAHEVTGSCTLIEACGRHILVDCGMEQGEDIYENCELPIAPGDIDAICLTHAHIDHSGKLPAIVALGYDGPIYSTVATHRLCEIMLRDSAHIQEFEAQWRNRKAKRSGDEPYEPMYTMQDAERTLELFASYGYGEEIEIFDGITVSFSDAGHLLGSASVLVTAAEDGKSTSVLFSGDLGNLNRPLIRDPQKPPKADYVVIESTYGNRLHGERPDYIGQLTDIMQATFDRGGNVVIPSFAVGRTQELLYLIRIIKEKKLIKYHDGFSVYVDSPLAVEATNIYSGGMMDYYDRETLDLLSKGIDPIHFPGLKLSLTSTDSRAINEDFEPKVIISASGMCEAGRIRHHLKHNLWREDSTILFVGYQTEGTVGRKLLNGAASVRLFGEEITVNADIKMIDGISGHADRDMLLSWLADMPEPPKKVFVNHGGDDVCDHFANRVYEELGYFSAAPYSGDVFDLETGECVEKAPVVRIPPKVSAARKRANAVFERLVLAGRRLMSVIEQNRGGANKDLAKFTSQIEALCEKWERK